jgi:hypothetical protein
MVKVAKLSTYEGRLAEVADASRELVWLSDKDELGETVEGVMAKLLELRNNPYGIPLQRSFKDDTKPDLVDTTLVDIVNVYLDNATHHVVATLRLKERQTPLGKDEKVTEEMVDESIEDTFPASDPPALKSTR